MRATRHLERCPYLQQVLAQHRRNLGSHAADASVRAGRSHGACRRQLLLARARTGARADRDATDGAFHMRRCRAQHASRRVLDLRHLADAQRRQRSCAAADPPGGRHRRRDRLLAARGPGAPACAGERGLAAGVRSTGPGLAAVARLRVRERAGGDDALGVAGAYRLRTQRGAAASKLGGGPATVADLRAGLAWAVVCLRRAPRGLAALSRPPRCRAARSAGARSCRHRARQHHRADAGARCLGLQRRARGPPQRRGPGDPAAARRRACARPPCQKAASGRPRSAVRSPGVHRQPAALRLDAAVRDAGSRAAPVHDRRRESRADRGRAAAQPGVSRVRIQPSARGGCDARRGGNAPASLLRSAAGPRRPASTARPARCG